MLSRRDRTVRVDVHDAVPQEPRLDSAESGAAEDESGRGLLIVGAVADAVGVQRIPGDGKHVYAAFHA